MRLVGGVAELEVGGKKFHCPYIINDSTNNDTDLHTLRHANKLDLFAIYSIQLSIYL
jgi:hypothetical protein